MNALEMHIEIDLSAQKIRSNYYRKFDPEEIDWMLNKHVDRFIKDRIKTDQDSLGFDMTQIDADALRTLIVSDRSLPIFFADTESVKADLPGNYSFLIEDYSYSIDKCEESKYKKATISASKQLYLTVYKLDQSAKSAAPFYTSVSLVHQSNTVISLTTSGLGNKDEVFTVRDLVLSALYSSGYTGARFYWERFDNSYFPNSIIAVSDNDPASTVNTVVIDAQPPVQATQTTITRNVPTNVVQGKMVSDRLVRGNVRSNVRTSSFARSKASSPISALDNNQLKIYCEGRFIVSDVKITYVRKPARISLSLNQNCDLPEEFHQEICDRVVLYIKELILSPDWEVKLRDLMMNKN